MSSPIFVKPYATGSHHASLCGKRIIRAGFPNKRRNMQSRLPPVQRQWNPRSLGQSFSSPEVGALQGQGQVLKFRGRGPGFKSYLSECLFPYGKKDNTIVLSEVPQERVPLSRGHGEGCQPCGGTRVLTIDVRAGEICTLIFF